VNRASTPLVFSNRARRFTITPTLAAVIAAVIAAVVMAAIVFVLVSRGFTPSDEGLVVRIHRAVATTLAQGIVSSAGPRLR